KGVVTVQMAAWNALYQIRDFSAHVQQLEAFAGAERAAIEKLDKQTWRIQGSGTITVRYATYWDEIGPFGTQLNAEHAFINPAMILLYIPDRRAENVVLSIPNPPENWRAASATGIESPGGARTFFFKAATYDDFADGPIEIGNFQEFDLPGVSPRVTVLVHGEKWRRKLIEEDLKRICEYETKLMEGAPFEHYTFLLHIGKGAGGGGMEHAYSTAIGVSADEYPAGVAAHELLHLWNDKRRRPATLAPVDYTKGQVRGDLLDSLSRDRTNNSKSLDDVLRAMNRDFAKQGKLYRDSLDVRLEAEKVAGGSFEDFFEKYVAGTEPFPYEQILGLAGLALRTTEHRRAALGF